MQLRTRRLLARELMRLGVITLVVLIIQFPLAWLVAWYFAATTVRYGAVDGRFATFRPGIVEVSSRSPWDATRFIAPRRGTRLSATPMPARWSSDWSPVLNDPTFDADLEARVTALGWPWACVYSRTQTWRDSGAPYAESQNARAASWDKARYRVVGPTRQTFSTTSGAISTVSRHGQSIPLAYRPLWLGLLSNTLVMAIPIWCVLLLARFVWSRRRTGRCRACDYDLANLTASVCPECGTPISPRR